MVVVEDILPNPYLLGKFFLPGALEAASVLSDFRQCVLKITDAANIWICHDFRYSLYIRQGMTASQ